LIEILLLLHPLLLLRSSFRPAVETAHLVQHPLAWIRIGTETFPLIYRFAAASAAQEQPVLLEGHFFSESPQIPWTSWRHATQMWIRIVKRRH
jgi:hypothetical protein